VPPDQRNELEQRVAQLDTMIGAIAKRDDDDRRTLETRRRAASEGISSASRARAAATAYASETTGRGAELPRYQDRKA